MRRILIIALFLSLLSMPLKAQQVDIYIDMNTGTVGDALTVANLNAGTVNLGAASGWQAYVGSGSLSLFKIGPHLPGAALPCPLTVGGVTIPVGHPSKSITLNNSGNFQSYQLNIPSGHRQVTVAGFIQFGAVQSGAGAGLFDTWRILGRTGGYAIMQLRNPGGYAVNIETDASGTIHSNDIAIKPNTLYWMSLNWNSSSGTASLFVYNTIDWKLIDSATVGQKTGIDVGEIDFGNQESGLANGTLTYFENNIIDLAGNQNPIAPNGCGGSTLAPPTNLTTTVQ